MGHLAIDNPTPFVAEPLLLADEELRPLLVPVVKATFAISPRGALTVAEQQVPLEPAGRRWDDTDTSSYRYEPDVAFFKPATDVALVGHACAPAPGTRELIVALRVGALQKGVRVLGERTWFTSLGSIGITRPVPFERIPLRYERAFGGWDRSSPDPAQHTFEPRNPVGVGFRRRGSRFEEGLRLPNLEDPAQPLRAWGETPPPVGFGFLGPEWRPRAALGGTYDAAWQASRKPLLPRDFDRRFFNAASSGLVAPGYLRGDEEVLVSGTLAQGGVGFRLPGVPPPRVRVECRRGADVTLSLVLDTVVVDTDAMQVVLTWRQHLRLEREPTDVRTLQVIPGG